MRMRLIAMLLTACMVVGTGNVSYAADKAEPQSDHIIITSPAEITVGEQKFQDELIVKASTEGNDTPSETEKTTPADPVHNCTKDTDTTDWSYVYFGSYPQTEVTGEALTEAIIGASYDANGDAWVDGTKYRRISAENANNAKYFGDSTYRYFKWERIKWRVLRNDGSTLFVAADQGLDCKNYNEDEEWTPITWEECTLRNWLNNSFYETAFSSSEQNAIVEQNEDKVDLLSVGEVTNPYYGFCKDYTTRSVSRRMQTSDYAHAMGAWNATSGDYAGNCCWWQCMPGIRTGSVAFVDQYGCDGYLSVKGDNVNDNFLAIVPTLRINLFSDFWSAVEDGSGGEGEVTPSNPVHNCTADTTDATDWSYVYFGSYPQTEVTGEALTEAITEAIYDANGDAWVEGTKYRRVRVEDANNTNYFGDSTYRYFKWERIKWRVLRNDGSTMYVIADQGLDCKKYNDTYASITWEECTLRNWLNSSFYGTAFSKNEQSAIIEQTVVNEGNPYYGTEGGNTTKDKVYLLSIGEVTNSDYGFCEGYDTDSVSRRMQISDYAHAMGTWNEYTDSYRWVLRSPGNDTYHAADVDNYGYVDRLSFNVNVSRAVVPALHINLSSDLWYTVDDGSSGEGGSGGTVTEPDKTMKIESITLSKTQATLENGEKLSLTATVVPENATDKTLKWSSSHPSVASVKNGLVTAIGKGTAIITAESQDGSGITAQCMITVTEKEQQNSETQNTKPNNTQTEKTEPENQNPNEQDIQDKTVQVTKITINGSSQKIVAGKKVALTANVFPQNATNQKLKWTTSNKKYATVNNKGVVTTKKSGAGKTVTITAEATDGSDAEATIELKLMQDTVTKIIITNAKKTLKAGKTMQLKATVKTNGNNANKKLQWTTSNSNYATVNSKGKVTAKKVGKGKTVTITAMSSDGTNKKAKVKIKIK